MGSTGVNCELDFNETYTYDIIDMRLPLLYELTWYEDLLLYDFTFLIILHIKRNVGKT